MGTMTRPDVTDWREQAQAVLARRGLSVDDLDDLPEVADGETDEDRALRLRQQAENRAARWRRRLPPMYADADLNDLEGDQHREAVTGWLASDSCTLILAGTVGGGKTHAAYAVGHHAVNQGLYVEAITVHDLMEALRPDGDAGVRMSVNAADLLVLDDLGATKATEFAQQELTALIDRRLNHGLRQVVTTNATATVLAEVWGTRLTDRLAYRATVLVFAGKSRRVAW